MACSNAGSNHKCKLNPDKKRLLELSQGSRIPDQVPDEAVTSSFRKGTMNEFSDVDPRAKEAGRLQSRQGKLLKKTQSGMWSTSNVGENTKRILDKKGENAEDFGKIWAKVPKIRKTKLRVPLRFDKGNKAGSKNVKDNTLNTTRDLTGSANRAAEDTTEDAKVAGGNLFEGSAGN